MWVRPLPAGCLFERQVTDLKSASLSNVAVLDVTDLTAVQADAAAIAEFTRGQWGLGPLHWLRDTLYREDDSAPAPAPAPWPLYVTSPSAPTNYRPHRHHRSHPLGQPRPPAPLHDPRTRSLILERP